MRNIEAADTFVYNFVTLKKCAPIAKATLRNII